MTLSIVSFALAVPSCRLKDAHLWKKSQKVWEPNGVWEAGFNCVRWEILSHVWAAARWCRNLHLGEIKLFPRALGNHWKILNRETWYDQIFILEGSFSNNGKFFWRKTRLEARKVVSNVFQKSRRKMIMVWVRTVLWMGEKKWRGFYWYTLGMIDSR